MAEEIKTTVKQQLMFNMVTGTYDYKPAEESTLSARKISTTLSSPREEEKRRRHKKTKKKTHRKPKEEKISQIIEPAEQPKEIIVEGVVEAVAKEEPTIDSVISYEKKRREHRENIRRVERYFCGWLYGSSNLAT